MFSKEHKEIALNAIKNHPDFYSLNSPADICDFLKLMYRLFRVSYVIDNGLKYIPRQNIWTNEEDLVERGDHDPTIAQFCIFPYAISPEYFFETAEYHFEDNKYERQLLGVDDYTDDDILQSIVLIPENIVVKNPCGYNRDERGSDHMNIILPFETEIVIEKGIYNLQQLMSKLISLRSHKFENWYELITGVLHMGANMYQLDVDHGS